ncbi:universal stress protein [Brumimicrobium aurantiacum]|uniref:Universal stress protein n=1 Tax=Brumimicrobium aurantiacum TaxID=1737063 RepID=A0A3E1EZZ9_9FLAO|nr:universal stress protein [Brumimicrobium aurantiacum]RFC55149.1 universal stress protein [Brumimicrobium aurantiacum]
MSANMFIIPHDFTSVGDAALKYGIFLSKPRKTSITLLHIVNSESNKPSALTKLNKIISDLNLGPDDISIESKVVVGSIFEDIAKIAEEEEARLIIMGTHGAKGMQKLFGSYAMKVISNSSVPFLVVQDGVERNSLDNIVVPISTSKESLQIIHFAGEIARTFDSKIHVIAEHQSDQRLSQQLKVRISLVSNQFEEKGIDCEIHILKERKAFHNVVVEYAKKNHCDMIAVSHHSASLFSQFEKYTQNLITNEGNFPCLIVNAKLLSKLYY